MRPMPFLALSSALLVAACAGLTGADTTLYDRLDVADVTLAAETLQETLERAPRVYAWVDVVDGRGLVMLYLFFCGVAETRRHCCECDCCYCTGIGDNHVL